MFRWNNSNNVPKIVFLVPEGLLLVVWSSVWLWVWLVCGSKVSTLRWVGLGWVSRLVGLVWRKWTHRQLCPNERGSARKKISLQSSYELLTTNNVLGSKMWRKFVPDDWSRDAETSRTVSLCVGRPDYRAWSAERAKPGTRTNRRSEMLKIATETPIFACVQVAI